MSKEHVSVCAASGDTKVEEGDPAGDERGSSPGAGPSSSLPQAEAPGIIPEDTPPPMVDEVAPRVDGKVEVHNVDGGVVVLGPGSAVDLLRKRLKVLREPIYGTKSELWARLAKAERAKQLCVEKEAEMQKSVDERVAGVALAYVSVVPGPDEPTALEKEMHVLSGHIPPARWCDVCNMVAPDDPHRRATPNDVAERSLPMVLLDYGHNKHEASKDPRDVIRPSSRLTAILATLLPVPVLQSTLNSMLLKLWTSSCRD